MVAGIGWNHWLCGLYRNVGTVVDFAVVSVFEFRSCSLYRRCKDRGGSYVSVEDEGIVLAPVGRSGLLY